MMKNWLSSKILIVDDNEVNREILKDIFDGQYEILEACDGEEAIEKIERYIDELVIIFLDMVMPKKTGLDVLEHMAKKEYLHYVPVMMITGESTPEIEEQAYIYGVADIVYKPFYPRIVKKRTMNVVQLYQNRLHLENKLQARTRSLQKSRRKLQKNTEFLINALSSVVEYRNRESVDRTNQVKYCTEVILHNLVMDYPLYRLSEDAEEEIVRASTLHDIGKIAVPDSIFLKNEPLTEEENQILQKHTIDGCKILERFKQEENSFYSFCYDICRYHHERWDGSGYPEGLKKDEIPIWAQVVGIADYFVDLCKTDTYMTEEIIDDVFRTILIEEKEAFSPAVRASFEKSRGKITEAMLLGVPEV